MRTITLARNVLLPILALGLFAGCEKNSIFAFEDSQALSKGNVGNLIVDPLPGVSPLPSVPPTDPLPGVSPQPDPEPIIEPTVLPTLPAPLPTVLPSPDPTLPPVTPPAPTPTVTPTFLPTPLPTVLPSPNPTLPPVTPPAPTPTVIPTFLPTPLPTVVPSPDPTLPPEFPPEIPPSPQPSPSAPVPTVRCLGTSAAVVGFSNTAMQFSGNGTVNGDAVLFGQSTLKLNGNAKVTHSVFTGSADRVRMVGNAFAGAVVPMDLSSVEASVLSFANGINAMTKAPRSSIVLSGNGGMTLQGNGGMNVIQVNGDIKLAGNSYLTLQGNANDVFIIVVTGSLSTSGNAAILLSGSVSPSNVLFFIPGSGERLKLTGNGGIVGTFMAPQSSAMISGNGHFAGAVFAFGSIKISGNGLVFDPAPFCPTPGNPAVAIGILGI